MAEATARLGLPLIQVGQAQKEVTVNTALQRLDAYVHLAVKSRALAAPPAAPGPGERWIVAAAAVAAWAGQAGSIAEWSGSSWSFLPAAEIMLCWIIDESVLAVFGGSGGWNADFFPLGGLRIGGDEIFGAARADVAEPTGGTVIDSAARAAIAELIGYFRTQGILGS